MVVLNFANASLAVACSFATLLFTVPPAAIRPSTEITLAQNLIALPELLAANQARSSSIDSTPRSLDSEAYSPHEESLEGCGSWIFASAFISRWDESTNTGCAIAGNATSRITYSWSIASSTAGGSVCVQGHGARIPKGSAGGQLYWHAGGCGASGAVTVDWQNSLHYKAVRFTAAMAPAAGVAFSWQ